MRIKPGHPIYDKLARQGRLPKADHIADANKMIEAQAKPRKYRNVHVEADGQRFDSKHEYECYKRLVNQYGAKNVIRQVSIPIGKLRIRPDFMVVLNNFTDSDDGLPYSEVRFYDAKGVVTEGWKAKANDLEGRHGIEIRLI